MSEVRGTEDFLTAAQSSFYIISSPLLPELGLTARKANFNTPTRGTCGQWPHLGAERCIFFLSSLPVYSFSELKNGKAHRLADQGIFHQPIQKAGGCLKETSLGTKDWPQHIFFPLGCHQQIGCPVPHPPPTPMPRFV